MRVRDIPLRRRAQVEANAWRAVEGVMADRRISKRLKGKVMSTCVTPVSRARSSPVSSRLLSAQLRRSRSSRLGSRKEE